MSENIAKGQTFVKRLYLPRIIGLGIGIAQHKPQESMKNFVHRVDQLMYQAKKSGKDKVYSETT